MKLLVKIFKYLLLVLAVVLLVAGLTALSWWMQWPLFTGLAIVTGLVGLVLAWFGIRTLGRIYNKKTFVKSVLSTPAGTSLTASLQGLSRVESIWNRGLDILGQSPMRFHSRSSFAQPWYVVLDSDDTLSPLFREFGTTVDDGQPDPPLCWHLLTDSVMLHVKEGCGSAERPHSDIWEEVALLMARHRRSIPLRGFIFLLPAADMARADSERLRSHAHWLRSHLQQVMLIFNKRLPAYVLVRDMEELPGGAELARRLPASLGEQPLGRLFSIDPCETTPGTQAADCAADTLEYALQSTSLDGIPPHGDELGLPLAMRHLGRKLDVLLECAFRTLPHQITPRLRGLFFGCTRTASGQTAPLTAHLPASSGDVAPLATPSSLTRRPAFLNGLITGLMPGERNLTTTLNSRFAIYASTKVWCMGAWLAFLLCLCGLVAANTVYQNGALQALTEATRAPLQRVSMIESINTLYANLRIIEQVQNSRRAWMLPTFGHDMLGTVEHSLKQQFTSDAFRLLFVPTLQRLRADLTNPEATKDQNRMFSVMQEVGWLVKMFSEKLEKGTTKSMEDTPYPLTQYNEEHWNPFIATIFINTFDWLNDKARIEGQIKNIGSMLALGMTTRNANVLDKLVQNYEQQNPSDAICLSAFWPHVGKNTPADRCISPAYTVHGSEALEEVLEDILAVTGKEERLTQAVALFRTSYRQTYEKNWQQFLINFNAPLETAQEAGLFQNYADANSLQELPYLRLLREAARELTPLMTATPPAWVREIALLGTMNDIAFLQAPDTDQLSQGRILIAAALQDPGALRRLLAFGTNPGQLRELNSAIVNLANFYVQLRVLRAAFGDTPKALSLTAIHYGGQDFGDLNATPFSLANNALARTSADAHLQPNSPGSQVLRGLLEFMAQGLSTVAAKDLQRKWEKEVLESPINLYRQNDMAALHGEGGVVRKFMETHLKPYLAREHGLVIAETWNKGWNSKPFPFTNDFLQSLTASEVIGTAPPKANYEVLLHSQPTLVNVDAREKPNATVVNLKCHPQSYELNNRNYPVDQLFVFTPDQCGQTVLSLRFPSFNLEKRYEDFSEFVTEFQYGERIFSVADFPEATDKLAQARVNTIEVRILPDQALQLLRTHKAPFPVLQDRITHVW